MSNKWYDCTITKITYEDKDSERCVYVDGEFVGELPPPKAKDSFFYNFPMEMLDRKIYEQILSAIFAHEELDGE